MADERKEPRIEDKDSEQGNIIKLDEPEKKSDEDIIDNVLDELPDEQKEPETRTEEPESETGRESIEIGSQKGKGPKTQKPKWLWILMITILLTMSAGGGYFLIKKKTETFNSNDNNILYPINDSQQDQKKIQTGTATGETLELNSFVIPFEQSGKFTCVAFSLLLKLPDKEAKNRMILDKNRIRAMLYENVLTKMNISDNKLTAYIIKTNIITAVDEIMPEEGINGIKLLDFTVF